MRIFEWESYVRRWECTSMISREFMLWEKSMSCGGIKTSHCSAIILAIHNEAMFLMIRQEKGLPQFIVKLFIFLIHFYVLFSARLSNDKTNFFLEMWPYYRSSLLINSMLSKITYLLFYFAKISFISLSEYVMTR